VITLLAFVFVLGVLVFVHELGHFLAAKRVGIRVLKFQLGFNPTIASFRHGDTEYSIGALPLGGYVKMAGENPEEERTGRSDEFLSAYLAKYLPPQGRFYDQDWAIGALTHVRRRPPADLLEPSLWADDGGSIDPQRGIADFAALVAFLSERKMVAPG